MPVITPPSVNDVGTLLRARTVDQDGNEIGTFDSTTRPTGEQVESYISQAIDEITTRVGESLFREEYASNASNLAAIRAAMTIELSHYPEQVNNGTSSFDQLSTLYETGVQALADAVRDGSPTRKGFFSIVTRSSAAADSEN
jgi:hypothetical protein